MSLLVRQLLALGIILGAEQLAILTELEQSFFLEILQEL